MRVLTADELIYVAGGAYNSNDGDPTSDQSYWQNLFDDLSTNYDNQIVVTAPVTSDIANQDHDIAVSIVNAYIDSGYATDIGLYYAGMGGAAAVDGGINSTISNHKDAVIERLEHNYDMQGGYLQAFQNEGFIPHLTDQP